MLKSSLKPAKTQYINIFSPHILVIGQQRWTRPEARLADLWSNISGITFHLSQHTAKAHPRPGGRWNEGIWSSIGWSWSMLPRSLGFRRFICNFENLGEFLLTQGDSKKWPFWGWLKCKWVFLKGELTYLQLGFFKRSRIESPGQYVFVGWLIFVNRIREYRW